MGYIAKVLSIAQAVRNGATITDILGDIGGEERRTGEQVLPPNVDALPLEADQCVAVSVPRSGGVVVVGYLSPDQEQKAQAGEYRAFARNSEREEMAEVWIKQTGEITLNNAAGFIRLEDDGRVNINGVIFNTDGTTTSPVAFKAPSIVADGRELAGHDHEITGGSSAPGPTGPNNA